MSFKKGLFRNIAIAGSYNYLSQAILFSSTIITSRILSPENFGFFGLIAVFTGFISIFSDSGLSQAIIRSDYKKTYHKAVDNLSIYIGAALCLLTCAAAYPIAVFYGNKELILPTIVLSLNFILKSLTIVRTALLSKNLQFNTLGKENLFAIIIQIFFTIMLALSGTNVWSLIIPQLLSSSFLIYRLETHTHLGLKIYPPSYSKVAFKKTREVLSNVLGFNIVGYWARNFDNLLVGKLHGMNDLGIYNRAYNLLAMPLSVTSGLISTILFPSLQKLKDANGDIQKEYYFVLRIILAISFPVTTILVLLPSQLVSILWGHKWMAIAELLPYFGILFLSQSLLSTTGNVMILMRKERAMRIAGWLSTIPIVAGISYGATISILGIAQYYSLAFILIVLPFNIYYVFYRTLNYSSFQILKFWIPTLIVSLFTWCSCFYLGDGVKSLSILSLLAIIVLNFKHEILNFLRKRNKNQIRPIGNTI